MKTEKGKYSGKLMERIFKVFLPDGKSYSLTGLFKTSKYEPHQGEKEKARRMRRNDHR